MWEQTESSCDLTCVILKWEPDLFHEFRAPFYSQDVENTSYLTKHCVFESNKIIFCSFMDSASSSTIFWAELTHKPRKYDQFLLILADDLSWSTKNFGEFDTETHIMHSPELYIVVWSRDTVFF